jgi:hypothetical protein
MRKWGDSSVTAEDMAALDYSTPGDDSPSGSNGHATPVDVDALVSADAMGVRTSTGAYEVADWDFRRKVDDLPSEDEILARGVGRLHVGGTAAEAGAEENGPAAAAAGAWGGMFARLTGKKVLTQEDLKPVLAEMEKHLMSKNVAKDIAEKLCDSVGAALVGKKVGGFSSEFPVLGVVEFVAVPVAQRWRQSGSMSAVMCSDVQREEANVEPTDCPRYQIRSDQRLVHLYHSYPHPQNIDRPFARHSTQTLPPVVHVDTRRTSRSVHPGIRRRERRR